LQMYPAETISLEKGKLTLSGEPWQQTCGPVIATTCWPYEPLADVSSLQLWQHQYTSVSLTNNHDWSLCWKSESYVVAPKSCILSIKSRTYESIWSWHHLTESCNWSWSQNYKLNLVLLCCFVLSTPQYHDTFIDQ
jgi:hypothetical protein